MHLIIFSVFERNKFAIPWQYGNIQDLCFIFFQSLSCFNFWKLNQADGRVELNEWTWIIKMFFPWKDQHIFGLPGEAEFPVCPRTAKYRFYLQHPFICCQCGAVGEVTALWQLSPGQDTSPALKCSFHSAHHALGSLPGSCLDYQETHTILWDWHALGLHPGDNPVHSACVIGTFLKSGFSRGNPGQGAEILTFWQDKNSS